MKKVLIAALAVAGLSLAAIPMLSPAAAIISESFSLSAAGTTPVLACSGQSQAEVIIYGPASQVVAATPQYLISSKWQNAAGFPSITQPGDYISTSGVGGNLRLNVSAFSGTQVNGQLVCGSSLPVPETNGFAVNAVPSPAALASVVTGGTAFVYQTLQTLPLTLGQSYGPSGQWYVTITEDLQNPTTPLTAEFLSPCISVTSPPATPSSVAFTNPAATTAPCASAAPIGTALAGSVPFAEATTGGVWTISNNVSHSQWWGILPSSSAWTFLCTVEGSTTGSATVQGSCQAFAVQI